jgi:putative transposase
MLHTHSRIYIHIVWRTKNSERILSAEKGKKLYQFLVEKSNNQNIPIERLNIQPEHVHLLVDLPTNVALADYLKLLKGSSSHWLNKEVFINSKFEWQRGFGSFSVSASQLGIVKRYIENQSEHHRHKTFAEEYEEWKRQYGIFDD